MSITVYGPTILANNALGQRNILISTAAPLVTDGRDGDVWLRYTA